MSKERYQRQVILQGFGAVSQNLLSAAKVLVIGAGGLGCPALQYLAAAGVGTIGIADADTVSISNLHRQVLFNTADLGSLKVQVARERLEKMNAEICLISHPVFLKKENIFDVLKSYDFVLDGTDNFESRYLINDACVMLGKPLVFAAVSGFEGQLAIFNVTDEQGLTCNYRDIFPIPPRSGEIKNCAENGVLGVLPGIIGTMAAAEMIKLIARIGRPLVNKLLHYNLLSLEQFEMNISPGNDYFIPATENDFLEFYSSSPIELKPGFTEIDAAQLTLLQEDKSILIIDVREAYEEPVLKEYLFKKKAGFKQVPMSEFQPFLNTDVLEKNVVFICQHGIRSITAAKMLKEKYGNDKNIYSLQGGIEKWRNYFL